MGLIQDPQPDAVTPDRRRTYAAVVLVEILVVAALWMLSRQFGY